MICAAWIEAHPRHNEKIPARDLMAVAGQCTPGQLNELHMRATVNQWKGKLKPKTVENYRNQFLRLVRHIGRIGARPDLDKLVPKVQKAQPRKVIATPEEIRKLIDAAPRWLRLIILLAAHAGMRRSDCMRVCRADFDEQSNVLTVHQKKTGYPVAIPATDELRRALLAVPTESPTTPAYMMLRDSAISTTGLEKAWWRLKKKTGVNRDLWLHDLRRTLAVSIYEVSKDLRVVEQMLGHQSLRSTIAYLEHRDPEKLKPYLDRLWKAKPGETIQ